MGSRILAIDYGLKRVGFAVSDPLGLTAQPLATLVRQSEADLLDRIRSLIAEKEVSKIVVGLPINMNGTLGPKAEEAKRFAGQLSAALGLPVELWDERLTSWQAEQYLSEAGLSPRKERRKGRVDRMAAQIMLQSYLDGHRPKTS